MKRKLYSRPKESDNMADCVSLLEQANKNGLQLSNWNSTNGSVVNITCSYVKLRLEGSHQLNCTNGSWSGTLPECFETNDLTEREKIIIGVYSAGVGVLLLLLVTIAICYFLKKRRTQQKRSERLAATLERLSIRDPLDELVRRESRRSSYGNPTPYMSSSFNEGDKRIAVNRDVQLTRLPMASWHYPGASRAMRSYKLYKIWDYTRTRKQFVFADGLDELVQKGADKLNLSGPIRVVLEEDGTEIDNDAVLLACAGMVVLLLEHNQKWSKPELVLSVHEYSNNLNHYRYDMDEKL